MAQWPGATRGQQNKHILEIGAAGFDRPGVDSSIGVISDASTGEILFDSEDATSVGGAAGLDIKYQFETRGGRTLRFRSILADFDTSNEITSEFGLTSGALPFPTPGVSSLTGDDPERIQYDYESRLLSFELMSCRQIAPGITFVSGPRYVSIRELVETEIDGEIDFQNGLPTVPATQVNTLSADNGLIGLQAGLEVTFPITRHLYTEGFIRAGGYYNPTEVGRSEQQIAAGQFIDPPAFGDRLTKSTGSFLGEVGGRVFFNIIPDTVDSYVGYEATWIDGIALAPVQLLSTTSVDTANTLFYQAVTFGVRMQF